MSLSLLVYIIFITWLICDIISWAKDVIFSNSFFKQNCVIKPHFVILFSETFRIYQISFSKLLFSDDKWKNLLISERYYLFPCEVGIRWLRKSIKSLILWKTRETSFFNLILIEKIIKQTLKIFFSSKITWYTWNSYFGPILKLLWRHHIISHANLSGYIFFKHP